MINGGEGGIRTLEGLQTLAGFQDQCIRPLCHLSVNNCDIESRFFLYFKLFIFTDNAEH